MQVMGWLWYLGKLDQLKKILEWFGWEGVSRRLPRMIKWTMLGTVLLLIVIQVNRSNSWEVMPLSYDKFEDLASKLAWPATATFIAYLLRRPISTLLERLRSMKWRVMEVLLSEQAVPRAKIPPYVDVMAKRGDN